MAPLTKVAVTRSANARVEVSEAYWRRLRAAGLDPVDFTAPGVPLRECAGLVLTGGADVSPVRYGEDPGSKTQAPDRKRDEFELGLLEQALAADMPVLAICRGHQLLNVCCGGSLLQHVESGEHDWHRNKARSSRSHAVDLALDSRLAALWGGREGLTVNSRHHQAVTTPRLAPGLRAIALSADGLVEAMESERHTWVVGVQWHPERDEPRLAGFADTGRRLLAAFRDAVRSR